MLFKSSHDPDITSTQQLIIFCHAQERVLLPLPKSYEDAQELARGEFSLSGDVIFETDDLVGSDSLHVRIHRTAWQGVGRILRSVTVKPAHVLASPPPAPPPARPRPSEAISSGSRRLSSQKRISMVGSAPIRLSSAPSAPPMERHSVSSRKGLLPSGSPRVSVASAHKDVIPPSRSRLPSTPPSLMPVKSEPSKIEEVDVDEIEDQEELRILSPKKRSARPRIMSDYGVDNAEEEEEGTDAADHGKEDTEDFDRMDDAEFLSSVASARPASRARTPLSRTGSGSGSLVEIDASSNSGSGVRRTDPSSSSSVKQLLDAPFEEKPKENAEKVEANSVKSSQNHQTQETSKSGSQIQSQSSGDDSFLIMIEYNDDPDSRSLFKTRGRHSVSKVLMQACRTFGIEEYYRSARLVLVIEEAEGDGEIVYQRRYVCDKNESMGQAGAEPNARFIVEVDDN